MERLVIVPIVIGLVEVVKRWRLADNKYLPLIGLILGVIFGLLNGLTADNFITGVIYGLTALGLYDTGKSSIGVAKKIKGLI